MSTLQEYKCPSCGGSIKFDSGLQKMKCSYCDTEFSMETLQTYDQQLQEDTPDDLNWEMASEQDWSEDELNKMSVYGCKSCGGEIVVDESTSATACPFCDNPVVLMGRFKGSLRPHYILPFKLDKKAAKEGLTKHLSKKKLLPKVFKDQNHIDEIKGVYVPFWLFDADANATIRYKGQKKETKLDDQFETTKTSYYSIIRSGDTTFEKIPVGSSSKMDEKLMESIEPFDFKEAVDFQTAYLSGYLADKYDVKEDQSVSRANERIKESIVSEFKKTVSKYDSLEQQNASFSLKNSDAKYALYPVWLLNTTYNNEKYTFAMNGQTGKFVGNLPMDKNAFWKYFISSWAIGSAVIFALIRFLL